MTSYFEEHGIKNEESLKDSTQTSTTNYYEFLGLGVSSSHLNEPNNNFLHLANNYSRLVQEGTYDIGQQALLDNLVSQLLEEAQESAKGPPPASKSFIQKLPTLTENALNDNASCSICKESLAKNVVNNQVVELPCKHQYDRDCLVPWLELHNTCPVCRKEVPSDDPAWLKKQQELEDDFDKDWMYG